MSTEFEITIGDDDGFGIGIPDGGFTGSFAQINTDNRGASEINASDGSQYTDSYAALFPTFGPHDTQLGYITFELEGEISEATLELDVADLQSSFYGQTFLYVNELIYSDALRLDTGFQNSEVITLELTEEMIDLANDAGEVVIKIDHFGSNDFIAFDYFRLSGEYSDAVGSADSDGFRHPLGTPETELLTTNDFSDDWALSGNNFLEKYGSKKTTGGAHLGEDWNYKDGGDSELEPDTPSEVYAVSNGEVVYVGSGTDEGSLGNVVIIKHNLPSGEFGGEVYSMYSHLQVGSVTVEAGDIVAKSEVIGKVGDTGLDSSQTAHLHLEMFYGDWEKALQESGYSRSYTEYEGQADGQPTQVTSKDYPGIVWLDPTEFISSHTTELSVESIPYEITSDGNGKGAVALTDGDDAFDAGNGKDILFGFGGDDELSGGGGKDYLDGGADADELDGGAGKDTIIGGGGNDTLTGGDDGDRFVFAFGDGLDVITDFDINEDLVQFTSSGLSYGDLDYLDTTDGVMVSYSNADGFLLAGLTQAELDAADFAFV